MAALSPLRRMLGHSALYFFSNVAMRAMSVVLAPLYTRKLSPEDYGRLAWANTTAALFTLVTSLGLASALARFGPNADAEGTKKLVGSAIVLSLIAACVCVLFGMLPLYDFSYINWVLATAALAFGQGLSVQYFAARERSGLASFINVAAVACWLSSALYFVIAKDGGLRGALVAGCVATGIVCVLSLALLVRETGARFDMPTARRILVFSVPLIPHLLSNWVLSISDRIWIERELGQAALAPYAVAYFFNLACVMATSALSQALSPIFVREADAQRAQETLPRLGDACIAASVVAGVCLCALAPWVFPLLAPGPAYAPGMAYVPWLVSGALFQALYFVLSQGSWYSTRTGLVPLVTGIAALVNLAMNWLLIPRYGVIAAAWSTAAAYAVLALAHGLLARRLFPVAWNYGRLLAMLGIGVGACFWVSSCAS